MDFSVNGDRTIGDKSGKRRKDKREVGGRKWEGERKNVRVRKEEIRRKTRREGGEPEGERFRESRKKRRKRLDTCLMLYTNINSKHTYGTKMKVYF
jgi:hypothetical protein